MGDVIDYEFNEVDPHSYEAQLDMTAKHRMINLIFKRVKKKLKSQGLDKNYTDLKEFDVPENFHKLILISITRAITQLKQEVGDDGIKILSCQIKKVSFKVGETGKNWLISVKLYGDMSKTK